MPTTKSKLASSELETKVERIIKDNPNKRLIVVGTTCTGKSTLLKNLVQRGVKALDMDDIVFSKISPAESEAVCKTPWTKEIGMHMTRLAKTYVDVRPGNPVFGTVVFDCDLIIYLRISDRLLRERTTLRGCDFGDAKNMQEQIEREIKKSKIRAITIDL